ncbi:MlaC/ttg2D family ABC transporter substrate-binding protein [Candidatus Methylopumilus turicensis]|jgi:phospholipid transport system substrate-binding protein|uniref:Toluene tolerance family protein n=1 Tax=Candidatus Methylopumilus turicensis TaxID=1581680 RepID=A0A0B7IXU5_9PROT|nr:ABC transporter substrate-binding protein [Candidatus Methylopumilus turicensis]CEN55246.1 Toluene tolerance family protein [Candidatus Methylopumilus turicensis]
MKYVMTIYVGLIMIAYSAIAQAIVPADVFVKSVADEVLSIVKKDKDIQNGDQAKVFALAEEKIVPNFNFDHVCKLVLGKNFSKATKEQQEAFEREFRSLLIRTYASALSKYRNQTIEYKPLREAADDKQVVIKTLILQPGGQPLGVDYSVEQVGDAWKVYDITIEGVSLVTNYRGQFSSEIRQGGMDGLIQKLVDKNKSNAAAKK